MMNYPNDTFEAIAADAVELLLTIIADLSEHDEEADLLAAAVIAMATESLCNRAIAIS